MVMDSLQRVHAFRRGGHSFVTELPAKVQTITKVNSKTTPKSIFATDREGIDLILSQLSMKKCQLEELDQVITSALTTRAAPIPLFNDTSNTKYSAGKYLQVQVLIPSTLK